MPVSMSGSWNISGAVAMDPIGPFVATPGPTSSLFAIQNQPIVNFNPLIVTGGYTPYTYFVSSGILPPGLTLNPTTGVVSGTSTTVQFTAPTVFAVRDAFGNQSGTTATVNFAVQVLPVSAIPGTTTSVTTLINSSITSFSPFSSVSNGFGPYVYSVSSGTLPTGITLDSNTGVVSGTPTVAGAATVVFAVRDSQNNQSPTTATVSFSVTTTNYTIQYLVVGGGGSGGTNGGGGGGGGAAVPGSIVVSTGTNYPITIGAGGTSKFYVSGEFGSASAGRQGNASSAFGTTAPGGGAGGGGGVAPNPSSAPMIGASGGGGGGPGGIAAISTGSGAIGSLGTFGWPGMSAIAGGFVAAGGGGASPTNGFIPSGAGGSGSSGGTAPSSTGGRGGCGFSWPVVAIGAVAGGGGGSVAAGGVNGPAPAGGAGGSQNGTPSAVFGGGGGGSNTQSPAASSGAGGTGAVILTMPNAQYPSVLAPGAAVSAGGLGTVLTYSTPGSYTFRA